MTRQSLVALLVALAVAGACSGGGGERERRADERPSTSEVASGALSSSSSSTSTTAPATPPTTAAAPPVTTAPGGAGASEPSPPVSPKEPSREGVPAAGVLVIGPGGAALSREPGGAPYGRLRADVAVAFDAVDGLWARVLTPCENRAWASLSDGRVERAAEVVLDPGHGGSESGATGPGGLTEKELNLDVARLAVDALRAQGIDAVLTRPSDYRVTLASRVAVAGALRPKAFVSVHHNAEPDGPRDGPGSETFYQFRSAESKRLAGLLYEEIVRALSDFSAEWVADRDAGAKYRVSDSGTDYYGILRRSAEVGLVTSLAELAFISNPTEEALLRREDVRQAEAGAITRALARFLRTEDPGSGFTIPYPRAEPAGPGGGTTGCVDPM